MIGLDDFLLAAQATVDADYNQRYSENGNSPKLSFEFGRRYVRIVSEQRGSRSAFGFIDTVNGSVLKSDSWKSPAKNFARGNINDERKGCGRIRWTGVQ